MSLNNPEYAIVKGKRYKINTDFRVAIECDTIARNSAISEQERALAIIYKLFGNEGLDSSEDWEDLLKFAQKYFCMKASMSVNIALNSWLLLQKIYLGVIAMKYCRNNFAATN